MASAKWFIISQARGVVKIKLKKKRKKIIKKSQGRGQTQVCLY